MPEQYGLSIDIGTHQITVRLIGTDSSRPLLQNVSRNPHIESGLDIITRARFASELPENLKKLSQSLRTRISLMIDEILLSDESIYIDSIVIVGNSIMHHLFFELPVTSFLEPPYETEFLDPINSDSVELDLNLPNKVPCYSPPLVGSFLGADASVMLLLSRPRWAAGKILSLDIGTNTEIALICKDSILMTSAASGSAFEGMSLECGMPSTAGAISSVRIPDVKTKCEIEVIRGSEPLGLCGSGAISILAGLRRHGLLNIDGSFVREIESKWLYIDRDPPYYLIKRVTSVSPQITISQYDIRMLQQSKAAIRAAVDYTLECAGCETSDVNELLLTGQFGSELELADVMDIGMLPNFKTARIEQQAFGAIRGAEMLLFDFKLRRWLEETMEDIIYLDLMDNPRYDELYQQAHKFPQLQ